MNKLQHIISTSGVIILIVFAIYLSSIGYGEGHTAIYSEAKSLENIPSATQLSIVYDRTYLGKTDFLHLKVDTTYHTRGKNGYCYEITCSYEVSLSLFDGEYNPIKTTTDACFVEGSSRDWMLIGGEKMILEYACNHALMATDDTTWEAWYCSTLPHTHDIDRLNDRCKGLILAACNSDKSYMLKARYIKHKII